MRRVIIESPYAGDIEKNLRYVRACMRDCLLRAEAPFASHALYTQAGVLRDEVPNERDHGIKAGFAWRLAADMTVVYTNLGFSRGMQYGIEHALKAGQEIEFRKFLDCTWTNSVIDVESMLLVVDNKFTLPNRL